MTEITLYHYSPWIVHASNHLYNSSNPTTTSSAWGEDCSFSWSLFVAEFVSSSPLPIFWIPQVDLPSVWIFILTPLDLLVNLETSYQLIQDEINFNPYEPGSPLLCCFEDERTNGVIGIIRNVSYVSHSFFILLSPFVSASFRKHCIHLNSLSFDSTWSWILDKEFIS